MNNKQCSIVFNKTCLKTHTHTHTHTHIYIYIVRKTTYFIFYFLISIQLVCDTFEYKFSFWINDRSISHLYFSYSTHTNISWPNEVSTLKPKCTNSINQFQRNNLKRIIEKTKTGNTKKFLSLRFFFFCFFISGTILATNEWIHKRVNRNGKYFYDSTLNVFHNAMFSL